MFYQILLRAMLLARKMLRDFMIGRHVTPGISLATCVTTHPTKIHVIFFYIQNFKYVENDSYQFKKSHAISLIN